MKLKYHGISYIQSEELDPVNSEGMTGIYRGNQMTFSTASEPSTTLQHQLTYRGVAYPEMRDRQRPPQISTQPSLSV